MKTVRVMKPYLNHAIGSVIEVRDQDYLLLKPRGVVVDASEVEQEVEPEVTDQEVKKAHTMTTKNIVTKKVIKK